MNCAVYHGLDRPLHCSITTRLLYVTVSPTARHGCTVVHRRIAITPALEVFLTLPLVVRGQSTTALLYHYTATLLHHTLSLPRPRCHSFTSGSPDLATGSSRPIIHPNEFIRQHVRRQLGCCCCYSCSCCFRTEVQPQKWSIVSCCWLDDGDGFLQSSYGIAQGSFQLTEIPAHPLQLPASQ